MAAAKDPRVITPIPQALLDQIDDYRFKHRVASRAEAMRRLIAVGLAASETLRSESRAA